VAHGDGLHAAKGMRGIWQLLTHTTAHNKRKRRGTVLSRTVTPQRDTEHNTVPTQCGAVTVRYNTLYSSTHPPLARACGSAVLNADGRRESVCSTAVEPAAARVRDREANVALEGTGTWGR
jgi:hypothetical protein